MPAISQLLADFQELRQNDPTIRAVDAAARLSVSEGELVEARSAGDEVARLSLRGSDFATLIEDLMAVGRVMTLTRNDAAVHETKGPVSDVSFSGAMGQSVGAIDLRMFLRHWHVAYHISEETKSGLRHSFQIFGRQGKAILKIYAMDDTDMDAWNAVLARHGDPSDANVSFSPAEGPAAEKADDEIDQDLLRQRWQAIEHSHEFFMILEEVGASRQQALRLAGDDLAQKVPPANITSLLTGASEQEISIMCFVGNPGCIQIYAGQVERIVEMGPWLNILDPAFNLHLRLDKVANAWLVRKPTKARGLITSIELFDEDSTMVCQFFGSRPPQGTENPAWRALANGLIAETSA
ncbi:MAG: ChuX/HutX family heme-like substrate-binding protein [Pseudomonadota bacterium]